MPGADAWSTGPDLSEAGWARVRQSWSERLAVPLEALTATGTRFFARDQVDAVVVVELGGSCVVVGPRPALAHLEDGNKDRLVDLSWMVERLELLRAQPIGAASLSFCEVPLAARSPVAAVPADPAMVDELRRGVDADEWDESGLGDMPQRWVAMTSDGRLAALAGFEQWEGDLAQLGVATHPAHRRHGYATAATAGAVSAAVADGLVVQWRCRQGNNASQQLATSMGFARVGRQITIALG